LYWSCHISAIEVKIIWRYRNSTTDVNLAGTMLRPSVVLNLNLMDQEAHLLLTSIHISCLSNRDLKLFTEHVVADFSCVEPLGD